MDLALRVSHYIDPAFRLHRDVTVLVQDGLVAQVIPSVGTVLRNLAPAALDLGRALCLPGFVNAHAHLDLSHLWRQVPRGLAFHEWVPAVVAARTLPATMIEGGIEDACRMLVAGGTTAVLDVSVGGNSAAALSRHGLRGTVALEVLGFDPAGADAAMQRADEVIRARFELDRERLGADAGNADAPAAPGGVGFGYSPHAPYSTSADLFRHAFGRACGEGRVCTTHAAETPEETRFLQDGTGPLRELLQRFGVKLDGFHGFGAGALELLLGDWLAPWLAEANPHLVLVHCNYPGPADLELLARTRPSVCYCPRSHAWFEHQPWPAQAMLDAGVNLVLGTDSLASNEGLDPLGELRVAATAHPGVPLETWFRAATVNGRTALGIAPEAADLTAWVLPVGCEPTTTAEALDMLLREGPPLLAGVSQGAVIARSV